MKKNSKEDRTAHEQQMRSRIKDAAFKLMAEKGIDGVSMREIAEKVHVTKPVLYYYFKDKEDLCLAIIEERGRQFDEFLDNALAQNLAPAELLGLVFEKHVDFFQKDPRNSKFIAKTIAYALSNKNKNLKKDNKADRFHSIFTQAAANGEIAKEGVPDVEWLVYAVLLQIMLSAYIQLHAKDLREANPCKFYDVESMKRLAQIIVLGVNEYYKRVKK